MPGISNRERLLQRKTVDMCWKYLSSNFSKFSQKDKLRITIALCTKDIPQELEGIKQQIIISATIQKDLPGEPENTNRIAEYFSAEPYSPSTT